jgi:hypothetical protein
MVNLELERLAEQITNLHLGVPFPAALTGMQARIWKVARAHLEHRKLECGICSQQAYINPEHAVVLYNLLRFCCRDCFGRVERAIMHPPIPDRDGI